MVVRPLYHTQNNKTGKCVWYLCDSEKSKQGELILSATLVAAWVDPGPGSSPKTCWQS